MARAAVVVVAAVGAAGVAPAAAAADEALLVTGSITYTWQGDPARGCASAGVCDVQGALIVQVQGSAFAQRHGRQTFLNLFSGSATVRVLTGSGASAGECVDVPSGSGNEAVFVGRDRHGRLVGTLEAPLSSGRCAGPVASDLARLTLPVRMGAGKRPAFDLRTSQTFAAGPFTGRLVSTVVMRAAPGAGSGGTSSSSFGGGAPPPHKVLVEQVTLHYRVAPLPGSIQSSFSGESDPFCEALDSCGASGTLALSLGAFSKTYTVTASRIVKRSVDARHAIADLRRGQLFVNGNLLSVPLVGTETLVRADGSRCQDSVRNGVIFTVGRFPPARGTGVFLAQANTGSDALRTHCPGPSSADVLGGGQDGQPLLARGPLDPPQLLRRHSRLTLSNPGGFSGLGYVGSRAGAVGLSLTLISIRAATKQEEVP